MSAAKVFYASGARGRSVRADGEGGTLAKGWYVRTQGSGLLGPFASERKADDFAGTLA